MTSVHILYLIIKEGKTLKMKKGVRMTLAEKVMKQEYRKCDMMFSQLHAQSRGVWPH